MKLAIAIITAQFSFGMQAEITICNDDEGLVHIRNIVADADDVDVRLYKVEDDADNAFGTGFISDDGRLEIKGYNPTRYTYLCKLTAKIQTNS